jgi:hypothetical protein
LQVTILLAAAAFLVREGRFFVSCNCDFFCAYSRYSHPPSKVGILLFSTPNFVSIFLESSSPFARFSVSQTVILPHFSKFFALGAALSN